jgi:hypothetical protein
MCRDYLFLHDDPSLRLGASNVDGFDARALRAEAATKRLLLDRAMGMWATFTSDVLSFFD